jgi:hypothetical protein
MQEADGDQHFADKATMGMDTTTLAEEAMAATILSHPFPNRPVMHSFSPTAQ